MAEINEILINMRRSFSLLWDEYGFKLIEVMPKSGYRDSGYYARLENDWCAVVFQSESGYLENISVVAKEDETVGEFVSRWAFLTTGKEVKHIQKAYAAENVFAHYADFSEPYLREVLKLIQFPALFKEKLAELEAAGGSNSISIEQTNGYI